MEYLQHLLDNTQFPILTAFILGLMVAISPCPLATNITAIGFISKDLNSQRRIFINGIVYTLGRAFSYTVLGIIIYFGVETISIKKIFVQYGEKIIGPFLIIIGVLLLEFIKIKFPSFNQLSKKIEHKKNSSHGLSAFLLGVIFALAFCPSSGVFYFGMLIPLTVTSPTGLFLPLIFAIATGLPVIIVAYLLAFSISSIGSFYHKTKIMEKWFRRILSIIFISIGFYYTYLYYLQ